MGGTFWGLCKLLCPDCKEFAEASDLAQAGDAAKLNLLVEDIYGGDYEMSSGRKLPGQLVASFFAKAQPRSYDEAAVLNALITMISQNICQIAFLNSRIHGIQRIIFTGNFLRQNVVARQAIATNMRRVSQTAGRPLQAHFLQHDAGKVKLLVEAFFGLMCMKRCGFRGLFRLFRGVNCSLSTLRKAISGPWGPSCRTWATWQRSPPSACPRCWGALVSLGSPAWCSGA